MKHTILLCCFFNLISSVSFAQMVDEEWMTNAKNYKLKYPDDDVLMLSSYEKYSFDISYADKSDPKIIAYKEVTEEYIALKDNVQISFGDGYDSFSEIKRLAAQQNLGKRYKPIPLQVNDREYSSDDLFDSDSRDKYLIFPMNTLGIRMQGSYIKNYTDVRYLTTSYFVDKMPCLEKTIEIEIPDYLDLEIRDFNFNGYDIKKETTENKKAETHTITFTMKDMKGVPSERNAPDISKIFPHIVFVAKHFTDKNKTKIQLFENTADQYKWYKSLVAKIENNDADLKPVVDNLVKGKTTDLDKIKSIYYWVQDNIKYIAFERGIAGFQPEAASMVYKNKFGDCKGMANLLTTMLKIAGFDARLTWIGTNDRPYDYSLPSMIVDNHMICALKLNNKFYFLDGTEKYIAFDDYAQRIQGRQALIEDGSNYVLQNVPTLPVERNKYIESKTINIEGDKLKAQVSETYNGESQTNFLRAINDISNSKRERVLNNVLSGGDKNFDISNVSNATFEEREKPIHLTYDAMVSNKVTQLGNEAYVSIDFNNDLESLIAEDKRKNSVEVEQNILREYTTELQLPSGYKVKQLPSGINIKSDNYAFDVNYKSEGSKIILSKKIMMKNHITDIKKITQWNQDLKKLKDINNEQIILEKL